MKDIAKKDSTYVLVIHYRHGNKPDECFYLLRDQVLNFHKEEYKWGDLIFNKADREKYKYQSLADLAQKMVSDTLACETLPVMVLDAE